MQSVYRSHISLTSKIRKKQQKKNETPAAPPMLVPLWVAPPGRDPITPSLSWESKGPDHPQCHLPQRNVTLLRDY